MRIEDVPGADSTASTQTPTMKGRPRNAARERLRHIVRTMIRMLVEERGYERRLVNSVMREVMDETYYEHSPKLPVTLSVTLQFEKGLRYVLTYLGTKSIPKRVIGEYVGPTIDGHLEFDLGPDHGRKAFRRMYLRSAERSELPLGMRLHKKPQGRPRIMKTHSKQLADQCRELGLPVQREGNAYDIKLSAAGERLANLLEQMPQEERVSFVTRYIRE